MAAARAFLSLRSASLALLALGAAALLPACSPPKGDYTGRVDTRSTTPAERGERRISVAALSEQSDLVAEQLAADLNEVPDLNRGYRSTVVFGDISNKTGIVPTTDFEAFRANTRAKLMQSRSLNNKVRFVENRARVEDLVARERGTSGDLLQEQGRGTVAAVNPEYTYFLNGDMFRVDRGGGNVNYYTMTYNLTSMATGEIIWISSPYEVKQAR
jgi:hypothetical protein